MSPLHQSQQARLAPKKTALGLLVNPLVQMTWSKHFSSKVMHPTLLHFDQKSDARIVGFMTLPYRIDDTMIFFKRRWIFVGYPTSNSY